MKIRWAHAFLVSCWTLFGCGPHLRTLRVEPAAQSRGITLVSVDEISATAEMVRGNSIRPRSSMIEVAVSIRNETEQAQLLWLGQARLELHESATGRSLAGACQQVVEDKAAGPQPCTQMTLSAHGNTTLIIRFGGFPDYQGEPASRIILHLPLDKQPPIELTVVDVSPSAGPRLLLQERCQWAATLAGDMRSANGRMDFAAFSLLSLGALAECGSWVFGAAWSGADFPNRDLSDAFTLNLEPIRIAWFPGDSMPGLYGEGGLLFASWSNAKAPTTPGAARPNLLPHLSLGFAMRFSAPRRAALLPIVHRRKTELQSLLRVGYMRWFNIGERGGTPGMLFSWEARWL
jgi:hypothetical protein